MRVVFSNDAWEDYLFWQGSDAAILDRLNGLIEECWRHPFKGTGKPEPLRGELAGYWSRRITLEHRLIYRVSGKGEAQQLELLQARFHY